MNTEIYDYFLKCMMHQTHETTLKTHASKAWGRRHLSVPETAAPRILAIDNPRFGASSLSAIVKEIFQNHTPVVLYHSNTKTEPKDGCVLLDEVIVPWCDPNDGPEAVAVALTKSIPPLSGFKQIVLAINISNLTARYQVEEVLMIIEQMQSSYNVAPLVVFRPVLRDACIRLGFDIVNFEQLPEPFEDQELRMAGRFDDGDESFAFDPLLN